MSKTTIEWTDMVWNPVTGCTKVSSGCAHCYAERVFPRIYSRESIPVIDGDKISGRYRRFTDVRCHPERLEEPLHWRKPHKIFVCSMGDLFHEAVADEFIAAVFGVMEACPDHIFQVLTKRPERMRQWFSFAERQNRHWPMNEACLLLPEKVKFGIRCKTNGSWPLNNVWVGVSVDDQKTADERIPLLLQTPAAVRFVSVEPMLGAVNLRQFFAHSIHCEMLPGPGMNGGEPCRCVKLDWVIVGGESGPKARPMHPDWVRDVRDQCQAAGVSFHFKQWGEWAPDCLCASRRPHKTVARPIPGLLGCMFRCGKKYAGRLLDGREWNEFPDARQKV